MVDGARKDLESVLSTRMEPKERTRRKEKEKPKATAIY